MKKSILDLQGVKIIEKRAQSKVNGGGCGCGGHETSPGSCLCQTSV